MKLPHLSVLMGSLILVAAAACSPAAASALTPSQQTRSTHVEEPSETPSPSIAPFTVRTTPTLPASFTPTQFPSSPAPTITLPATPTPCPPEFCIFRGFFLLERPVAPPGNDTIDSSYRYGSTQNGERDPHHGVEFLNSTGTPVLAAAGGVVIVAGDDRQTLYSIYPYFYGNLVILEHHLPGLSVPLFTLYAHLSQISVELGEQVRVGSEIGRVGMTGAATGSHLHFEVRLGENTYQDARNPELWLAPHQDENDQPMGAVAGRVLDSQGESLEIPAIVFERLSAFDQSTVSWSYVGTYEERSRIGAAPWEESFAVGDLPASWYRISFVQYGMQRRTVQVLPGQLTVVTFRVGGS